MIVSSLNPTPHSPFLCDYLFKKRKKKEKRKGSHPLLGEGVARCHPQRHLWVWLLPLFFFTLFIF
jgi:hypothetical protein